MENTITKRNMAAIAVASIVGVVGLTTAGIALMWVAGSLGISTAAASQIVNAIMAGGWALSVVLALFGAGIIGAITATVRGLVGRLGQAYAIA